MKRTIKILLPPLMAIAWLYAILVWDSVPDNASIAKSSVDDKDGAGLPAAPTRRSVELGHRAGGEGKGAQRNALSNAASPLGYHCMGNFGSELEITSCRRPRFAAARSVTPGQPGGGIDSVELRQTLDWLEEDLLESESPLVREQAIAELAEIGGKEACSVMSRALADPDIRVRALAIEKLGEAGHDQLHVLGQVLFTEADPELRW